MKSNCDRFSLSLNSSAFKAVASSRPQPMTSMAKSEVKASGATAVTKSTALTSMSAAAVNEQSGYFEKRDPLPVMDAGFAER